MRIARVRIGGVEGQAIVEEGHFIVGERRLARHEVEVLVPCRPTKIVAIARNYRAHAAELGNAVPEDEPLFFLKPPSALLPDGGTVVLPKRGRVDYEGELGVVIGRRARNVAREDAQRCVLGYTCVFDITAREVQRQTGHFTLAKGFDTFCPVGPWIATDLDPSAMRIVTRRNGEIVQHATTSEMVHSVNELIAYLSSVMTLEPGDLIATGTPSGVSPLAPGDRIDLEIEGVGVLSNSVAEGV